MTSQPITIHQEAKGRRVFLFEASKNQLALKKGGKKGVGKSQLFKKEITISSSISIIA